MGLKGTISLKVCRKSDSCQRPLGKCQKQSKKLKEAEARETCTHQCGAVSIIQIPIPNTLFIPRGEIVVLQFGN